MLFDIDIRKQISTKEVMSCVSKILGIHTSLVVEGYEKINPDINLKLAVFLQFIERPAGFRLSVEFGTQLLVEKADIFNFLTKLSHLLNSDIFIDETDNYGQLFSPNGEINVVKYDIFCLEGEEYIDLI